MFSNFKDAFKDKPHYSDNPPQVILDAISSDLPNDLFYIHDHDGFCRLEASEGLQIQSGTIILTPEAKMVLPPSPTYDDIIRYSYNSQTLIKIQPNKEGKITVNGHQIDIVDMVKAPLKDIQFSNAELWMQPIPLPAPFILTIGNQAHKLEMLIKRIPNNSLYTQEFESVDSNVLHINYKISTEKKPPSFTFNLSFNIENAKKSEDIITAYEIFNSFLDGEGLIGDSIIDISTKQPTKKVSTDTITFWKKVSKLELLLNNTFNLKKDITVNDAKQIEALYCSLIENKPFKTQCNYDSVKCTGSLEPIADIEEGQEIYLEFEVTDHIDIFEDSMNLFLVQGIFGASIVPPTIEPESLDNEYEVKLKTVIGKTMYCSNQYFLTKEQLKKVREDHTHIETFRIADELTTIE